MCRRIVKIDIFVSITFNNMEKNPSEIGRSYTIRKQETQVYVVCS